MQAGAGLQLRWCRGLQAGRDFAFELGLQRHRRGALQANAATVVTGCQRQARPLQQVLLAVVVVVRAQSRQTQPPLIRQAELAQPQRSVKGQRQVQCQQRLAGRGVAVVAHFEGVGAEFTQGQLALQQVLPVPGQAQPVDGGAGAGLGPAELGDLTTPPQVAAHAADLQLLLGGQQA